MRRLSPTTVVRGFHSRLVLVCMLLMGCQNSSTTQQTIESASSSRNTSQNALATVVDLAGNRFDPIAQSAGKIAVLAFWRTDCPVARRYHPELRRLQQQYAERDVNFFLVFPNASRKLDEIRDHLLEFEQPCVALHDPSHALVAKTGASITPEAVVFDRQGEVFYRGRIDDRSPKFGVTREPTTHDLADAIDAALSGGAAPKPDGPAVGCYIEDLKSRPPVVPST